MARERTSELDTGDVEGSVARKLSRILAELAAPPARFDPDAACRLAPGETVGRYEVVRELGRGGFGVVYEARDPHLGRSVAIKVLRPGRRGSVGEDVLRAEGEIIASLAHPNLVQVHDAGSCGAGAYLVFELLRGETLETRLARGALPVRDAVRIAHDVALALAHAHASGVVHCDLKPANVFLGPGGQVKVLDFGLARMFGHARAVAGGTPSSMAPEQWRGEPEDERTDIWALGSMLFRMIAGREPFPDDDRGEGILSPASAPSLHIPDLPRLGALVGRMLEKAPAKRMRDGGAVEEELLAVRRALDDAQLTDDGRSRFRRRAAVVVTALVVLAAAAGMFLQPARPPADAPKITVAVADVSNETPERDLDGVSGLLATSLEQSRRLHVVARGRLFEVLRQFGDPEPETLDAASVRTAARRAGARAVLLASVRQSGKVYTVGVAAIDPAHGEQLFAVSGTSEGTRGVSRLVDQLAKDIGRRLVGGDEGGRSGSFAVAQLTTGDLEAYRHYFEALRLEDAYRYDDAQRELRAALREDPSFALAHLRLTMLRRAPLPGPDEAEHLRFALDHLDRLPERERLVVRAEAAYRDGNVGEAEALWGRAIALREDDKRAWLRLAELRRSRAGCAAALPLGERALALDPSWFPAQDFVAVALVSHGDFDRAVPLARHWAERWPSVETFAMLNGVYLYAGDPRAALVAARKAAEMGGGAERLGIVERTLIQLHDFARAESEARRLRDAGVLHPPEGDSLAVVLRYRGQRRAADALLEEELSAGGSVAAHRTQLALAPGDSDPERLLRLADGAAPHLPPAFIALVLALGGHADEARRHLDRSHVDRIEHSGEYRALAEGLIEAARQRGSGDLGGARRTLEDLRARLERQPAALAALVLGEICHEARDDLCATRALSEYLPQHWNAGFGSWGYPKALYLLAHSQERLGKIADARRTVAELLRAWKDADPDLPLLAEARALDARIGR
jgi:eukaryotic-like serine/threonine-protein kinase